MVFVSFNSNKTSGSETAYPLKASKFTPGFNEVLFAKPFVDHLSFCTFYFLSLFDIWLLNTPRPLKKTCKANKNNPYDHVWEAQ